MHGLINRSIQCFVRDTYGLQTWEEVTRIAELEFVSFEAMLPYEDALTYAVIDAISQLQAKPRNDIMEDIGTYLVSHDSVAAVRRLLRFGGEGFVEFLHSLDDLHDRVKLAVPDLDVPHLELRDHTPGAFSLTCRSPYEGFGHVIVGLLRGIADDYGALVFLEHQGGQRGIETIAINLADVSFTQGRSFVLSNKAG